MSWKDLEFIFNRAFSFSFSRKKIFFIFPILALCGIIVVLCRGLSFGASDWVAVSLTFLPIFFCSTLLLAAGIVLTRVYHHEVKQLPISYRKTLRQSWELIVGISYLSLPLVLAYLLLWTVLGIFYLLKEIPGIGNAIALVLSFGPFLLVLGSLILSLLSLFLLFFAAPPVALKSNMGMEIGQGVWNRLKENPFSNVALLFFSLIPFLVIGGLLLLAASITGTAYIEAKETLSFVFQWFFVILPFCAMLSPAVIFFFNFAAESYVLLRRKVS